MTRLPRILLVSFAISLLVNLTLVGVVGYLQAHATPVTAAARPRVVDRYLPPRPQRATAPTPTPQQGKPRPQPSTPKQQQQTGKPGARTNTPPGQAKGQGTGKTSAKGTSKTNGKATGQTGAGAGKAPEREATDTGPHGNAGKGRTGKRGEARRDVPTGAARTPHGFRYPNSTAEGATHPTRPNAAPQTAAAHPAGADRDNRGGPGKDNQAGHGSHNRAGAGSENRSGDGDHNRTGTGDRNRTGDGSHNSSGNGDDNKSGNGSHNQSGDGSHNRSGDGNNNRTGDGSDNQGGNGDDNKSAGGSHNEAGNGSHNEAGRGDNNRAGNASNQRAGTERGKGGDGEGNGNSPGIDAPHPDTRSATIPGEPNGAPRYVNPDHQVVVDGRDLQGVALDNRIPDHIVTADLPLGDGLHLPTMPDYDPTAKEGQPGGKPRPPVAAVPIPVALGALSLHGTVPVLPFYLVEPPRPGREIPPALRGDGTGVLGEYFAGANFETPLFRRADHNIQANWTGRMPDGSMPVAAFSVRWIGSIVPRYSEEYTIYTATDDGVRLWINGKLLIDDWQIQGIAEEKTTLRLEAGKPYDFVMEFFEKNGVSGVYVFLYWESAHQKKEFIPESCLRFPEWLWEQGQ
ncbi:MAG TPA: PA14 domain-containing protein [Armatimonadota bacterium]|jgi:hypothetical protein